MSDNIDKQKYDYFLSKYRAMSREEVEELSVRTHELADEASAALSQTCSERGISIKPRPTIAASDPKDVAIQSQLSSDLWNGSISKRIKLLSALIPMLLVNGVAGPGGLGIGAVWLVLLGGAASWIGYESGKEHTKEICSRTDLTIEQKEAALKASRRLLWRWTGGTLVIAAMVGAWVKTVFRI